jgi:hypothetical protein
MMRSSKALDIACGVKLNDGRALEQAASADEVWRAVTAVMDRAMAEIEWLPVSASLYQNSDQSLGAADTKRRIMAILQEYTYGAVERDLTKEAGNG